MPSALATEIEEAIKMYKYRLLIPELRNGTLETKGNAPVARTGQYARVYRITVPGQPDEKYAVRCYYNSPPDHVQQRYRALTAYFEQWAKHITAKFQYHDDGLITRVIPKKEQMPIMTMQWVDGETLLRYVDRLALDRNRAGLNQLADNWRKLILEMRQLQIAHGDLAHGNVMVRANGTLVLIDYDGVYVPTLPISTEGPPGNPSFQHKDWEKYRHYDAEMDHFSALLIYVVLLALSQNPDLWKRYSQRNANGDIDSEELMFTSKDLQAPGKSSLFKDLGTLADPEFKRLLGILRQACEAPFSKIPRFEDVVRNYKDILVQLLESIKNKRDLETTGLYEDPGLQDYLKTNPNNDITEGYREARRRRDHHKKLQQLLAGNNNGGKDEEARRLWEQDDFEHMPIAQDLAPSMAAVKERLAAWSELRPLLDSWAANCLVIEDHQKKYGGKLDNYGPAQGLVPDYEARISSALEQAQYIHRLGDALRVSPPTDRNDLDIIEKFWPSLIIDPEAKPPVPNPVAVPHEVEVKAARGRIAAKRLAALNRLRAATVRRTDTGILTIAGELRDLHTDTDAIPEQLLRDAITSATQRLATRKSLKSLLESNPDGKHDQKIYQDWHKKAVDGRSLGDSNLADGLRALFTDVCTRYDRFLHLKRLIDSNSSYDNDQEVVSFWEDTEEDIGGSIRAFFPHYPPAAVYERDYKAAKARLDALRPLEKAIVNLANSLSFVNYNQLTIEWNKHRNYPSAVKLHGSTVSKLFANYDAAYVHALEELGLAKLRALDIDIAEVADKPVLAGHPAIEDDAKVAEARRFALYIREVESLLRNPTQEDVQKALLLWTDYKLATRPSATFLQSTIEAFLKCDSILSKIAEAGKRSDWAAVIELWEDSLLGDYAPAQAPEYKNFLALARADQRSIPALKNALAAGRSRLVMKIWDDLEVFSLQDAKHGDAILYEEQVRAAKRAWLSKHVPTDVKGQLVGGRAHLTWLWPEGVTTVAVRLTRVSNPSSPTLSPNASGASNIREDKISRLIYNSQGGYKSEDLPFTWRTVDVSIYPCVRHASPSVPKLTLIFDPSLGVARIRLRAVSHVTYQLAKDRNGIWWLVLDASQLVPDHPVPHLPALTIVGKEGSVPSTAADGQFIGHVEHPTHWQQGTKKYRVKLLPEVIRPLKAPFVRVFPQEPQVASWLRLVPVHGPLQLV